MGKINSLLRNKISQAVFLCFVDILSVAITAIAALWIQADFEQINEDFLISLMRILPIDIIITILVFYSCGLYAHIWRYASVIELFGIIISVFISEVFATVFMWLLNIKLPLNYPFLHFILMVLAISAMRFSHRIIRIISTSVNKRNNGFIPTLLIGAGEAARLIIDESNRNSEFKNRIVAIVDDDGRRKNTRLRGIPIIGDRHVIKDAIEKYDIKEIIIAIPSAPRHVISKIISECQSVGVEIKIVPSIFRQMSKSGGKSDVLHAIRPISYEDFLGRDQIVVNNDEICDSIKNKTILVTGGGGSIGSELCRQIAKCNPKRLVIFDIYENNAYEIQQELYRNYPNLNLATIIGSVRDYDRLEKVFEEYEPEYVYHAAAHKHVPLMEISPNEAIKNNCLGTLNTVKLSDKYGVEKFVLISTDKAVRPTNIMGASKRICEMIVQTYDKMSETDFVAVRFGNVLGSNGSVIPLFLKQIEAGGPVTVTHRDITRYFMTIPEAVSLVLQAGVYAKEGEIFVLDMGKPVKIYDLAKRIIRYKGLEPGKDIKIKITGLRPGEKLYEEMLMEEEGLKETPNKLIHIGKPIKIEKSFLNNLDKLIESANNNSDDIKRRTAEIVKTYNLKKEK